MAVMFTLASRRYPELDWLRVPIWEVLGCRRPGWSMLVLVGFNTTELSK
jgi:hypothetical protein